MTIPGLKCSYGHLKIYTSSQNFNSHISTYTLSS